MKNFLTILLALPLCCMTLSSCGKQSDPSGTAFPTAPVTNLSIVSERKADYVLILPKEMPSALRSGAILFAEKLLETCGAAPERKTDAEPAGEKEILIGETNRPQSQKAAALLGNADYLLAVIDGKLTIVAAKAEYYARALEELFEFYADENGFYIPADLMRQGSVYASFLTDEKTSGNTRIDITLRLNQGAKPGILIGEPNDTAKFGYSGIAITLEQTALTLWQAKEDGWNPLAVKNLTELGTYDWYKLRVETSADRIRMYLLDDMEGIEPWPEAEIPAVIPDGSSIVYIESAGKGADYKDFIVSTAESEKTPSATYTNSVYRDFADPDVQFWDGKYYLYATGGAGYLVHSSDDLVNWKYEGVCMEPTAWGFTQNYWAPDVDYIDGKFYMVCSVNEHLGIASSDSPTGPFIPQESYLFEKSIDGHIFVDDDGNVYLYYVSWREGHTYAIWGCQMDRTTMKPLLSTEKLIIQHTEPWEEYKASEEQGGGVCESPYMLKHNGIYYMTYSGSDYVSQHYAVGYAISDSPLGNFEKYTGNPIMIGNAFIAGTGHHCIVTLPDGGMYIVYHCHKSTSEVHDRKICVDRIRFSPTSDSIDRLEVYGPTTTPQPIPETQKGSLA